MTCCGYRIGLRSVISWFPTLRRRELWVALECSVDGGAADAEGVADLGQGEVWLVVEFFRGCQFVAGQ